MPVRQLPHSVAGEGGGRDGRGRGGAGEVEVGLWALLMLGGGGRRGRRVRRLDGAGRRNRPGWKRNFAVFSPIIISRRAVEKPHLPRCHRRRRRYYPPQRLVQSVQRRARAGGGGGLALRGLQVQRARVHPGVPTAAATATGCSCRRRRRRWLVLLGDLDK